MTTSRHCSSVLGLNRDRAILVAGFSQFGSVITINVQRWDRMQGQSTYTVRSRLNNSEAYCRLLFDNCHLGVERSLQGPSDYRLERGVFHARLT